MICVPNNDTSYVAGVGSAGLSKRIDFTEINSTKG